MSDRKTVEAEVANSDLHKVAEAQAALLDSISEGIIIRRGQRVVYLNTAAKSMFGFDGSDAELNQQTIDQWIHPNDRAIVEDNYRQRMLDGEASQKYDFRILRQDHSLCWVTCSANKIDWEGEPAVAACLKDITAQRAAAQAYNRTDRLFTNIFRLTPEVMMLSSLKDGKIIDINPAFLNVFGRRRDDVVGKTSGDLGIWADPTFLGRFVEELKMTASMTDVPATVKIRGNMIRHFRLFAQKIDHENEQILLLIGRDVTDDLVHSQELQRSRDNAELANRAKSEFLANMSHELRTPLNAILGFAEILRDEMIGPIGNPRYSEYAQDIHESGTHLLDIINDILDLSKVEAGRLEAHLTWIEPVHCLEMCLTLVQQQAFDGDITVRSNLDDTVMLEADERLVKQIGLNLLTNAVKFTASGGTVELALQKTANAGLCLSVIDTGIGMTADEIKVARRPFGQIDSSLARKQEGSGLGLPLVSAFAEKLNATLTIESQSGHGTRVSVTFPPFKVRDIIETEEPDPF